jgi:nucleotide-binding universal stress UspA family protein
VREKDSWRETMFEKILFATDFSEYADKILDYIAGFPRARDIILLHVIEETRSPRGGGEIGAALFQDGSDLLKKEKHHLENLGKQFRVSTAVKISSDLAGAIVEMAEKSGVSLIVVGARGGSMVDGILLGSISHAVLRRSRTNVLIIRHKIVDELGRRTYETFSPTILNRVVCPVDFSEYSDRATYLLGRTGGVGEVILLHVVSRGESQAEIDESIRRATDQLEAIRSGLAGQGLNAQALVRAGNPADEITKLAEEKDASVIWMSSHGRGWFDELLLGSTASTVAMNAKRPVIIIRQPVESNRETVSANRI